MDPMLQRTALLLGEDAVRLLKTKHVLVFGLGGVGGYAAEALCRGGIGRMTLVDAEKYEISNCNRQAFATSRTVGMQKVFAARERLCEIAPGIDVRCFPIFYGAETEPEGLFDGVDYVLDAVDTVSAKLLILRRAGEEGVPVVSCMGTGNKLDPTAFRVAKIEDTKVCPLARVIREECRKRGVRGVKVVYSEEAPKGATFAANGRNVPGSVSFVPGVAGMILAGEIIKDLIKSCSSSEPKN